MDRPRYIIFRAFTSLIAFTKIFLVFSQQEEESTATFTPVVQLEAVEVKTMEEEEDVVYKEYEI